ncbi:anti-sigma factor family protein [Edaphobacter albus]|uniref:anti-sigma factor family protein n=1 Tax=Edaphobacter sp. 4G125 TaxID=2763071 RepID=UPI0016445DA0|nr:hypothetical protein [Edaphobacter sp. 4G125]QNI36659.1 hypothetical protein H7846_17235 [Edaphobacter sp. 4G125]
MRLGHLSQTERIQFVDGEMSLEEVSRAETHLKECCECRAALAETRGIAEELNSSLNADLSGTISDVHREPGSELAAVKRSGVRGWMKGISGAEKLRWAGAAACVVAVLVCLPRWQRSNGEITFSLPNRGLTPGMTRPVELAAVCSANDDNDFDPELPQETQKAVFREYGISMEHSAKDFQVDYLISPQLGGTDDVRNLWPQSYKETTWNAHAKDALERHLSRMVCERKITLAQAQREIASNWIAAYQKYFHTRRPV